MAEATLTALRNTHSALETVSDDILNQHLADAKNYVEGLGISSVHPRFSELQRYMACHLLSVSDVIKSGITSESVADVSQSFAAPKLQAFASTNWESQFEKVRVQAVGKLDICL